MSGVTIRLSGLAKNVYRFKNAGPKVRKIIKDELEKIAEEQRDEIQAQTPVLTGAARNAVKIDVNFGEEVRTSIKVYADLEEAPQWKYIEYGAPPHIIEPSLQRALKFEVDGQEVFARYVNHPGSTAKYIFRDAKEKWQEKIDYYSDRLKEAIAAAFE